MNWQEPIIRTIRTQLDNLKRNPRSQLEPSIIRIEQMLDLLVAAGQKMDEREALHVKQLEAIKQIITEVQE